MTSPVSLFFSEMFRRPVGESYEVYLRIGAIVFFWGGNMQFTKPNKYWYQTTCYHEAFQGNIMQIRVSSEKENSFFCFFVYMIVIIAISLI